MAYSYVTYTGDGSTTTFAIPFPYILKSHVTCLVNGVSTSFTWPSTGTASISPAPTTGAVVKFSRNSSIASRLVTYADGGTPTADVQNEDGLQAQYLCQEVADAAALGIPGPAGTNGTNGTNGAAGAMGPPSDLGFLAGGLSVFSRLMYQGAELTAIGQSTVNSVADTLILVPYTKVTAARILQGFGVSVAGAAAGKTMRCVIYKATSVSDPYPGALFAYGDISLTATGWITAGMIGATTDMPAGLYWIGYVSDSGAASYDGFAISAYAQMGRKWWDPGNSCQPLCAVACAFPYAAAPSPFPIANTNWRPVAGAGDQIASFPGIALNFSG